MWANSTFLDFFVDLGNLPVYISVSIIYLGGTLTTFTLLCFLSLSLSAFALPL